MQDGVDRDCLQEATVCLQLETRQCSLTSGSIVGGGGLEWKRVFYSWFPGYLAQEIRPRVQAELPTTSAIVFLPDVSRSATAESAGATVLISD